MGVVYKARDPIINRLVALKTITANVADNPELLQRFYREAQSAGSLQHPNIVTIYEMGDEGGVPFIAMQLVDGENLGRMIARRLPIPLSLKLVYAVEACRAFAYAHKQGIIHRDIKPGNVMVNKEGTVKVVDFGIARVLESSKTQTGMLIGTFAYMSPEVFNGEHADARSDIFSFGVLLYELLAYARPFPGDIPASLMQSICLKEPLPLREVAPDCSPELEAVVHRTLLKSVTERTQSMEDLLLELDPICKGLQAQSVADLVAQSRTLVQQHEYTRARELLRQALQVDFANGPARALLEKVNSALKRILIRPKVEQHINSGRAFLGEGRLQEAQSEVESALKLDSNFEPAEELLRQVQHEIGRTKLISEWLQASKQRLAEGLPEEAEAFLAKIQELDPANRQAPKLQQQVLEEKARRQRRLHLLETMQQARILWTQQKYEDSIDLLTELQKEFVDEEEVQKLLETVREDRAEHHKRQTLERARNLLVARSYDECKSVLTGLREQFPSDEEITKLLEELRRDQAEQHKLETLKEARTLLASRRHEDCLLLLASLESEFPDENEIARLIHAVHEDQELQQKEQGVKEARNLLASRRYDDCRALLTELQGLFSGDPEIPKLLETVREEQAEQRKLSGLSEAQNLRASKYYDESIALLSDLKAQFPDDREIPELAEAVRRDQAEQQRLQGLADARNLWASKQYAAAVALLSDLKARFPDDKKIPMLAEEVRKDQAEQQRLQGLAEARNLLASRRYEESFVLLTGLRRDFPGDDDITRLLANADEERAEKQKQQKLADARALLASQSFGKALTILDPLLVAYPKDPVVLKLRALILDEQEKVAKSEQLSRELQVLKKLVSDESYETAIARAENLLLEFTNDVDLIRLLEFARNRREQVEGERRLRHVIHEVQELIASDRLGEAIASARGGLESFKGNSDLRRLLEQVENRRKKELTRLQIQQRVREIRLKVHREEYSDAIQLAQDALSTLGPDTDLTQLLSSAQVEYEGREKKREQNRKLENVQALLELEDLEGARLLLDKTTKNEGLDDADPRVEGLSNEIAAATAKNHPLVPATPESPAKEYALLEGPPQMGAPERQDSSKQFAVPLASATQPLSRAEATVAKPQVASDPKPPAALHSQSAPPVNAESQVESSVSSLGIPVRRSKTNERNASGGDPAASAPSVEHTVARPSAETRPAPKDIGKRPLFVPLWKKPSILTAELVGLVLMISVGVYFLRSSKPAHVSSQSTQQLPLTPPRPNPIEAQQRDLIGAVDKAIGQGDFEGAKKDLEQAKSLNGPLNPAIDQKLGDVERALTNTATAAVLQKEEQLWKQATEDTDGGRFAEAQQALRAISNLSPGGRRKDEARRYLNEVLPRRQREEQLFAQARQAMNGKDAGSLQQGANLFGEVVKLDGPRRQEAQKNQQDAQASLANLNKVRVIAALTDGARQDEGRGDFRSARQKVAQIQGTGGDPTPLLLEIDRAEQVRFAQLDGSLNQLKQRADDGAVQSLRDLQAQFQTLADAGGATANDARRDAASITDAIGGVQARATYNREENEYQQVLQRYRPIANDKNALEASRNEFQPIVRGGGHRASDAQKNVDEINVRLSALNPPPPVSGSSPSRTTSNETPAVLAAVQRYADAFDRRDADALRQVWPTMTDPVYSKAKSSFGSASAIHLEVANEKVDLGADGTTATVNADITRNYTPKGEKTRVTRDHTIFHLVKSSGIWSLRDVE
jgi:serine/threonine protein kinase